MSDILPPIGSEILHFCRALDFVLSPLDWDRGLCLENRSLKVESSSEACCSSVAGAAAFLLGDARGVLSWLSCFCLLFFLCEGSSWSIFSLFRLSAPLLDCDFEEAMVG